MAEVSGAAALACPVTTPVRVAAAIAPSPARSEMVLAIAAFLPRRLTPPAPAASLPACTGEHHGLPYPRPQRHQRQPALPRHHDVRRPDRCPDQRQADRPRG